MKKYYNFENKNKSCGRTVTFAFPGPKFNILYQNKITLIHYKSLFTVLAF